ncbi:MAG: DUF2855 family protein [Maricaulaceae bacterium]
MTPQTTLCVNRTNFDNLTSIHRQMEPLAADHIRVRLTSFALTANNVTYMVTGDLIGYWKFFNPHDYGIEGENLGRMPVWGFAEITESHVSDLEVGTRIYGFFPVTDYFDIKPIKLNPHGFSDGADHRLPLHAIYNRYTRVDADPSFGGGFDDLQPILRPLFTTSFLIDDFLERENFFDAEQVLLLSGSSKTALGTAFCLAQKKGIKVTGLTSERNKKFVQKTGFYDVVESYDNITDLNPDVKTVIVDMAGNGDVSKTVYEHFGEKIVYNCMVGKSHWDGGKPPKIVAGAPPVMFFAPDQAQRRLKDWGPDGFAQNLGARWVPFCRSAKNWMNIERHEGADAFMSVYKALLAGDIPASAGQLMRL